ncbi:hypothetical protein [Frankia sp. AgKG'84/4]|uniref:hypothetical protein n=1 Tax=Frankia sp. AgKG'84/4 TaxID=573490 RepID=UPI00200E0AEB|nr:hypothetical protein [Frankia sp. AgKG'84/4]MCL9796488.1 hypothetical protein [Frankia sp. AgKG'84/4]
MGTWLCVKDVRSAGTTSNICQVTTKLTADGSITIKPPVDGGSGPEEPWQGHYRILPEPGESVLAPPGSVVHQLEISGVEVQKTVPVEVKKTVPLWFAGSSLCYLSPEDAGLAHCSVQV